MKTLLKALLLVLLSGPVIAVEKPASAPAAKVPVKEKVYELPKTGLNQARPNGGWINVEPQGTRLVVKFFDKEKKPMAPDVARGLAIVEGVGGQLFLAVMVARLVSLYGRGDRGVSS